MNVNIFFNKNGNGNKGKAAQTILNYLAILCAVLKFALIRIYCMYNIYLQYTCPQYFPTKSVRRKLKMLQITMNKN